MVTELQCVPEPEPKQPPIRLPAPRVRVIEAGCDQAIEPVLDETANLEDFQVAFLGAFGTTERLIAKALFEQILNVVHTEPATPLDAATANLVLALLHRIGP